MYHLNFTAGILLCFTTSICLSQTKTTSTFNLDAASKSIQVQIRSFENSLKKGDSVAIGNLYCIDAKLMNHGSPSTIGRADIVKAFGEMIRDSITGSGYSEILIFLMAR